jgi:hypothetical protein
MGRLLRLRLDRPGRGDERRGGRGRLVFAVRGLERTERRRSGRTPGTGGGRRRNREQAVRRQHVRRPALSVVASRLRPREPRLCGGRRHLVRLRGRSGDGSLQRDQAGHRRGPERRREHQPAGGREPRGAVRDRDERHQHARRLRRRQRPRVRVYDLQVVSLRNARLSGRSARHRGARRSGRCGRLRREPGVHRQRVGQLCDRDRSAGGRRSRGIDRPARDGGPRRDGQARRSPHGVRAARGARNHDGNAARHRGHARRGRGRRTSARTHPRPRTRPPVDAPTHRRTR